MGIRNLIKRQFTIFNQLAIVTVILGLVLSACNATPSPDPEIPIRQSVNATLAAIPTETAIPIPTSAPTPTQSSINNLFCEYNFCIGHPQDIYLIDQGSTHQPPVSSTYNSGIIFGYSSNLFIEINWSASETTFNPQTSLHGILTGSESFQGSAENLTVGNISVTTQPISTVTALLPYGLVAAWQCGDRAFAWKVYTPQDGMAVDLLKQSLDKFKCQGFE